MVPQDKGLEETHEEDYQQTGTGCHGDVSGDGACTPGITVLRKVPVYNEKKAESE